MASILSGKCKISAVSRHSLAPTDVLWISGKNERGRCPFVIRKSSTSERSEADSAHALADENR
jgi:hypothetical protein